MNERENNGVRLIRTAKRREPKRAGDSLQANFFGQWQDSEHSRWAFVMRAVLAAEDLAGSKICGERRQKLARVCLYLMEHGGERGCNAELATMVRFFARPNSTGHATPIAKRTLQKLLTLGRELGLVVTILRPGASNNRFDRRFAEELLALKTGATPPKKGRDTGKKGRGDAPFVRGAAPNGRDWTVRHSLPSTDSKRAHASDREPPARSLLEGVDPSELDRIAHEVLTPFLLDRYRRQRRAGGDLDELLELELLDALTQTQGGSTHVAGTDA